MSDIDTVKDIDLFSFSTALEFLKDGKAVSREGWNNPQISVHFQRPDENSKMTEPYLYMEKRGKLDTDLYRRFPLDLSCESLLADDWMLI